MAASTSLISVEEYLKTTTDPDCEYVAGVIEERVAGDFDHATWQAIILGFSLRAKRNWGFFRGLNFGYRRGRRFFAYRMLHCSVEAHRASRSSPMLFWQFLRFCRRKTR